MTGPYIWIQEKGQKTLIIQLLPKLMKINISKFILLCFILSFFSITNFGNISSTLESLHFFLIILYTYENFSHFRKLISKIYDYSYPFLIYIYIFLGNMQLMIWQKILRCVHQCKNKEFGEKTIGSNLYKRLPCKMARINFKMFEERNISNVRSMPLLYLSPEIFSCSSDPFLNPKL